MGGRGKFILLVGMWNGVGIEEYSLKYNRNREVFIWFRDLVFSYIFKRSENLFLKILFINVEVLFKRR